MNVGVFHKNVVDVHKRCLCEGVCVCVCEKCVYMCVGVCISFFILLPNRNVCVCVCEKCLCVFVCVSVYQFEDLKSSNH